MLNTKNNKLILTMISVFLIVGSLFPTLCMAKPQTTNHKPHNRSTLAASSGMVTLKGNVHKKALSSKPAQIKNVVHNGEQVKKEGNIKSVIQKSVPSSKVKAKNVGSGKSVKSFPKTTLAAKVTKPAQPAPRPKVAVPVQPEPQPNPDAKVAIISCCYGPIEASTKPVVEQSVPCDKIFFTDNPNINNRGNWIIDTTPYHLTHNKYLDTDYTNSWKDNKTNYMISKYYRAQIMDIPRLQKYDYILVLDGTMEITHKDCVKWLINTIDKEYSDMAVWVHHRMHGELYNEVIEKSKDHRWCSTKVRGQTQPLQNVIKQYEAYVDDGYNTEYWKNKKLGEHYGVFLTGFCLFKMNDKTKKFLDLWYEEMLKWTTECQISFSYVLQKYSDYKFSALPNNLIKGASYPKSNVHIHHNHGK